MSSSKGKRLYAISWIRMLRSMLNDVKNILRSVMIAMIFYMGAQRYRKKRLRLIWLINKFRRIKASFEFGVRYALFSSCGVWS